MWRGLNEIDNGALVAITAARNKVRERVWELIAARHGRIPPVRTCYGDLGPVICIRIDASLIEAHSDKQHAAGNFKGGYGFHPLLAWCDNTGACWAVRMCQLTGCCLEFVRRGCKDGWQRPSLCDYLRSDLAERLRDALRLHFQIRKEKSYV